MNDFGAQQIGNNSNVEDIDANKMDDIKNGIGQTSN